MDKILKDFADDHKK